MCKHADRHMSFTRFLTARGPGHGTQGSHFNPQSSITRGATAPRLGSAHHAPSQPGGPEGPSAPLDLFKVNELKDDKQKLPKNPGHEYIGRHPFRGLVSGESGSGKTTLVINLYNKFYAKYFDEIWVWSPNYYVDSTWQNLKRKPDRVFTYFDDADVEALHQRQQEVVRKRGVLGAKKVLVIVDDFASEHDAMHSHGFEQFYTIGRHSNVSILVIVQKLNKVGRTLRTNASWLALFHSSNAKELKDIKDEQSSQLVLPNYFLRLYNEATTRHPYGFLTINHQAEPRKVYRFDLTEIQEITLSLEQQRELLKGTNKKRKLGGEDDPSDNFGDPATLKGGGRKQHREEKGGQGPAAADSVSQSQKPVTPPRGRVPQ